MGNDGKKVSVMNIRNVDNTPYSEKHIMKKDEKMMESFVLMDI